MKLHLKSLDELLKIALNTTSLDEMLFLSTYPTMNVRRSLARNNNINQEIIDSLMNDPVQNVSYMAFINPNNKNKNEKSFTEELRPCVICQKSEIGLVCENCDKLTCHNF